jgi:hypothetical protein
MGTSFGFGGSTNNVDDGLEAAADATVRVANPLELGACAGGAVAGFVDGVGAVDRVDSDCELP